MHMLRILILLLLSLFSTLGCEPTTPNDGVVITSIETTTNEVDPSNIKMPGSLFMWMIEGDRLLIPIDVQNISSMNMETVTATIVSDLPGFTITNSTEFPLTSGSNHVVMIELDATDMDVLIGEPVTRTAILVVENGIGGSNEASVFVQIFDEYDVTENQLNLWSTTIRMDATAGGDPVIAKFTINSNWNEPVNYTATVSGVGFTVIQNASGVLGAGSSHEVGVQYMPPATMANPENEEEIYYGLLTIATPDEGEGDYQHQASIFADLTPPPPPVEETSSDDDDSSDN